MQVSIIDSTDLQRNIRVTLAGEEYRNELDNAFKDIARHAKLPGFRPGKIPMSTIKKQFAYKAQMQAQGKMIDHSFAKALAELSLDIAGEPNVTKIETDNDFIYELNLEVYPQIEIDAGALSLETLSCEVQDADIDATVANLQKQNASKEEVSRAAAAGDVVSVDVAVLIDGQKDDSASATGRDIELGAESRDFLSANLKEVLLGKAAGDEFEHIQAQPESQSEANSEEPAEAEPSKEIRFVVSVKSVSELKLPALDDAFCQQFQAENVETLRANIQKHLSREIERRLRVANTNMVLSKIVTELDFTAPKHALDNAFARYQADVSAQYGEQVGKMMQEQYQSGNMGEDFTKQLEHNAKCSVAMRQLLRQQQVEPDSAAVDAYIAEIAQDYDSPSEVIQYYHQQPQLDNIRGLLLEKQAIDWLLAGAKVSVKPIGMAELMAQ